MAGSCGLVANNMTVWLPPGTGQSRGSAGERALELAWQGPSVSSNMEMLGEPSYLCWRSGSALKQKGYLRDTCPLQLLPSQSVLDPHPSSSGRGTRYSLGPALLLSVSSPITCPRSNFLRPLCSRQETQSEERTPQGAGPTSSHFHSRP